VRVLWVLKSFGIGGAERLLAEVAPRLAGVRLQPVGVARHPDGLEPVLRGLGLTPLNLGARSNLDPIWVLRLRRLIRESRPDVVFLNGPLVAAGGRIASIGLGVPTVSWEHGEWAAYHPLSRWANALTAWRDAASVAVSEGVRRSVAAHPLGHRLARRMVVVVGGIDADRVRADAAAAAPVPEGAWGTVGHLTASKGVDTLVRAASIVQRRLGGGPLVVVGDGPEERTLRALAERLGVDVGFLGARGDARAICARLDVFSIGSRSEGLPIALLEAMALARPIVATRAGGIPEAIEDGRSGVLVPPDDPMAIAEGVIGLMVDGARAAAIGDAAREDVGRFDVSATAERLLAVWKDAVG
jgi:glycosyltransferase involved in cell wall biosynthesis